jgi:hypothetical protein
VKIYGNSLKKLLNRFSENSEINMKVLPLTLTPKSVSNSLHIYIYIYIYIYMTASVV